jgi:hypothetical protein
MNELRFHGLGDVLGHCAPAAVRAPPLLGIVGFDVVVVLYVVIRI